MTDHWQSLIANLAVVALFISTWVHGRFVLAGLKRWQRDIVFGAVMGLGAVASMLLTIPVQDSYFDLRSSVVAIAGFFGGPVGGTVAAGIAIAYRGFAVGGTYAVIAATGIAVAALTGIGISALARHRIPAIWTVGLFAVAVGLSGIAVGMLLRGPAGVQPISFEVGAMNAVATAISTFFMMRHRVIERERDLLRQAFRNSPDFQYVKTPDGRLAAVNRNIMLHHNYTSPQQMIGKTDFDLTDYSRAERLFAAEQAVLAGGPPIADFEELVVGPRGEKIWYLTSKVALRDEDGKVIGLAGVTRDVTVRRRLRDEAEVARNRLDYLLAGVSDGIAMFDRFGVLVYCNDQYRQMFSRSVDIRQPGRHINDILRAVAATGEQKGIPPGLEEEWVEEVASTLDTAGDQEIELWDGRWLQVKTRPTDDGTALIVVSDISTIKHAEAALREMTEQLRRLAATDGLTGLANRRAFDAALAEEIARARRTGLPLSVLLADVDRFKAYNDIYGHQAGDDALKSVGRSLREALRRPGDVAARYGGEEFVAILPNTDAAGAAFLADSFRETLKALAVRHRAADAGILTVSVGVARLEPDDGDGAAERLLQRADAALYAAKAEGRDRVVVSGDASEVRRVAG